MKEEIKALKFELEESRRAALEGRGQEAELARQMELKLEAEKEKRIEHTKQMAVSRILKRDLTRGWLAWVTPFLERRKMMRMLQAAGSKLLKPKLVASFKHWLSDWQVVQHEKATMSLAEMLKRSQREAEELQAKLNDTKMELMEARDAMMEGRGMEVEMQRQMEAKMERERQQRIEYVKERAIRRIGQRGLSIGWTAWYDMWEEAAMNRRLLKNAGAKLARPKLAACIGHWRDDWKASMFEKSTMSLGDQLRLEKREHEKVREQVAKLARELEQARDAMLEGRGQEAELARQMEAKLEEEREKRIEHTKQMAVRRIGKRDLTRGWVAWFDLYVEQAQVRRMRNPPLDLPLVSSHLAALSSPHRTSQLGLSLPPSLPPAPTGSAHAKGRRRQAHQAKARRGAAALAG